MHFLKFFLQNIIKVTSLIIPNLTIWLDERHIWVTYFWHFPWWTVLELGLQRNRLLSLFCFLFLLLFRDKHAIKRRKHHMILKGNKFLFTFLHEIRINNTFQSSVLDATLFSDIFCKGVSIIVLPISWLTFHTVKYDVLYMCTTLVFHHPNWISLGDVFWTDNLKLFTYNLCPPKVTFSLQLCHLNIKSIPPS